jgi:transposase
MMLQKLGTSVIFDMKYFIVTLSTEEREELKRLLSAGTARARTLTHARILLKADQGSDGPGLPDPAVAVAVEVGKATVARVRQRYVEQGLEAALHRKHPEREYVRKLDGAQEAQLVTLACSTPPAGHARWTLRLLGARLVQLEVVDTIAHETVRRTLKKTPLNRG